MARPARKAAGRSYDQYCAMARGLDLIGDRWTLLLIRDLLLGPKRYKDLLAGLPGIGTNLLADRLKELEAAGIVERVVLPPPAGSSVYQLTAAGEELEPVMMALGRWGSRFLTERRKTDVLVPRAYFVAMRGVFNPEAARNLRERYEVRVDGLVFEVRFEGGKITTREAVPSNPDVVMTMDVETLNALVFRQITPARAVGTKRVTIEKGDAKALERFISLLAFRPRPASTEAAIANVPTGRK